MKPIISIIGFGIVGKSVHHAFKELCDFKIFDTNSNICQNTLLETVKDGDFIFIAVPTPMKKDGSFDSSIIDSVVDSVANYIKDTDKTLIIKSTIIPETTQRYIDTYPDVNIIFCPEFLREKHYLEDAENPSRIVFGIDGDKDNFYYIHDKLMELYKKRFPETPIFVTNPTTAEMIKYTCNCFLATKVSFFNEMYQICEKLGINYDDMVQIVLADNRIGKSHYSVPGNDGLYGWGKKCFPKDINALIKKALELGVSPTMLLATVEKNLEVKEKKR